jgi:hypothetical protein
MQLSSSPEICEVKSRAPLDIVWKQVGLRIDTNGCTEELGGQREIFAGGRQIPSREGECGCPRGSMYSAVFLECSKLVAQGWNKFKFNQLGIF